MMVNDKDWLAKPNIIKANPHTNRTKTSAKTINLRNCFIYYVYNNYPPNIDLNRL